MLYRIVMDVFDMACKINIVAYLMLPKTPLPDVLLPFRCSACTLFTSLRVVTHPGKIALDQHPSFGKIIVSRRQRPEAVKMVRQHHNRIDSERMARFLLC
jgi:hypothetical protein